MFLAIGKGGLGSGNFGHVGRPKQIGGSSGMGSTPLERLALGAKRHQAVTGKKRAN